MDFTSFDRRPVIVAVAGPNGAGKTTFYESHLQAAAMPFINADRLARELNLDPYAAVRVADALRRALVKQRESFVFETVFSDPVGDKLKFLKDTAKSGYTVVLCYIRIAGPEVSSERVSMRVSQGGHDVPREKLESRFPRTLENLRVSIRDLPHVLVFDNGDLKAPFRHVAAFEGGRLVHLAEPVPPWLRPLLP
jgi:predicted ABC-type ATPase